MHTTAVVHSENIFNIVGNFNLRKPPLNLMLSSKVLTNCLEDFMEYTSETKELLPTNICAMVTPESIAGVSEKRVSVTASFLCGMLKAGNQDLK